MPACSVRQLAKVRRANCGRLYRGGNSAPPPPTERRRCSCGNTRRDIPPRSCRLPAHKVRPVRGCDGKAAGRGKELRSFLFLSLQRHRSIGRVRVWDCRSKRLRCRRDESLRRLPRFFLIVHLRTRNTLPSARGSNARDTSSPPEPYRILYRGHVPQGNVRLLAPAG